MKVCEKNQNCSCQAALTQEAFSNFMVSIEKLITCSLALNCFDWNTKFYIELKITKHVHIPFGMCEKKLFLLDRNDAGSLVRISRKLSKIGLLLSNFEFFGSNTKFRIALKVI